MGEGTTTRRTTMDKPRKPTLGLAQRRQMGLVLLGLGGHWDTVLQVHPKTNPYPLAPRDLRRMGKVTPESYKAQNAAFGEWCREIMERELPLVAATFARVIQPELRVIGVGLARDLEWIPAWCKSGFYIAASDVSAVAGGCLDRLIDKLSIVLQCRVGFSMEDINGEWIDEDHTAGYYACQLVQVLTAPQMSLLMQRIGQSLVRKPGRVFYLVHPFEEDNTGPRDWDGVHFPNGVEWGHTTPYSMDTLLDALGDVRDEVKVEVLGEHSHWHQRYKFVRFSSTRG